MQARAAISLPKFLTNAHFEVGIFESEEAGDRDSDSFVFEEGLRNKHGKAFIKRRRKAAQNPPNSALLKAGEARAVQLVPSGPQWHLSPQACD